MAQNRTLSNQVGTYPVKSLIGSKDLGLKLNEVVELTLGQYNMIFRYMMHFCVLA